MLFAMGSSEFIDRQRVDKIECCGSENDHNDHGKQKHGERKQQLQCGFLRGLFGTLPSLCTQASQQKLEPLLRLMSRNDQPGSAAPQNYDVVDSGSFSKIAQSLLTAPAHTDFQIDNSSRDEDRDVYLRVLQPTRFKAAFNPSPASTAITIRSIASASAHRMRCCRP